MRNHHEKAVRGLFHGTIPTWFQGIMKYKKSRIKIQTWDLQI
jgi:hypothetical protein